MRASTPDWALLTSTRWQLTLLCRLPPLSPPALPYHHRREVTQLSSYLVELSMVDYASLKFPYSMIAASAVYVAQLSVGAADPFCHTLSRHSGYTLAAIQDCSTHLANLMRKVRGLGGAARGGCCGLKYELGRDLPCQNTRPRPPPLRSSSNPNASVTLLCSTRPTRPHH